MENKVEHHHPNRFMSRFLRKTEEVVPIRHFCVCAQCETQLTTTSDIKQYECVKCGILYGLNEVPDPWIEYKVVKRKCFKRVVEEAIDYFEHNPSIHVATGSSNVIASTGTVRIGNNFHLGNTATKETS